MMSNKYYATTNIIIPQQGESGHLKRVQSILRRVSEDSVSGTLFSQDKTAIEELFRKTESDKISVLARLTVIDSLYSTQMNRRYYGLEELAESLCSLAEQQKLSTKELFLDFAKNQDLTRFIFFKEERKKTAKTNLFDEKYGIGKNGKDKGIAISLISKYAYFETNMGFPIYDSIACEIYPLLWEYCGFHKKEQPKLTIRKKGRQEIDAAETIRAYVKAINILIDKLGGGISYDQLDRLLWFTGKIKRGNLSLVLSRDQYIHCLEYSQKNHLFKETDEFSIQKVTDINTLPFIPKNSILKDFFYLAKEL